MMMTEVFEKLRLLQDVLARKNELVADIADAPKLLSNREELLERLKAGYIEKNEKYEELRKIINELKAKLFEVGQRRENSEKAMDNITTQREYEALDKEIQDAVKEEAGIRKELQRHEDNFKTLDDSIKQEEELIEQNETDLADSRKKVDEEIQEKRAELKKLEKEEKKIGSGLDDETIFKFERIIKNKQGLGIVSVVGNVCSGCHMILPAQFANEIHEGTAIMYCPYCSRVLFYEEPILPENIDELAFDDSSIGGLIDLEETSVKNNE